MNGTSERSLRVALDRGRLFWTPRFRTFAAALAALAIAVSPLGMRCAAAAAANPDPAAQARELSCHLVDSAAVANRLPAGFLARILWQESRFRAEATSPAGAEGMAQFMPRTAAERGLADPRDPAPAIATAARLLADLKLRFGNLGLAAAAYNAGTGRVIKWLRRQADLPAETRRYIAAVTGRPVEAWTDPAASGQSLGGGGEPCLAVVAGLARSVSAGRASPGWLLRLDRTLARAIGFSPPPPAPRSYAPESLKAAEGLCARLRSQGARCTVYQP